MEGEWQLVRRAALVEVLPIRLQQPPRINVVFVPDVPQRAGFAKFDGLDSNLTSLIRRFDPYSRLLEFRYQILEQFSWTRLANYGEKLLECLIECSRQHHLQDCPLLVVSYGLGGCITKRAVSIIHERYYDHILRGLNATLQGLIFLGTPHPLYGKQGHVEKLDSLLSASLSVSRVALAKIREEVGLMWNMSSKFEHVQFNYRVISAYELLPTTFKTGLLRSKREILVDATFATTSMRHERLIGVNADHRRISTVMPETELYTAIKELFQTTINSMRSPLTETTRPSSSHPLSIDLDKMWQSTPAASRIDTGEEHVHTGSQANLASPNLAAPSSGTKSPTPTGATAGSSQIAAGYEIVPVNPGPVSATPAVKLPCYLLRQYSKAGACFGREDVLDMLDKTLLPTKADQQEELPELKSFAICGLGGLGKTQIAVEFALTRKTHFDAIFFVYADSEMKIAESFNMIAQELGLAEKAQTDNSVVNRDRVVQWLNLPLKYKRDQHTEDIVLSPEYYANYLLIFDNADEPEILSEYWPLTGTGSVLVTSRDPLTKSRLYSNDGIDLDPIREEDAADLLASLTGHDKSTDRDDALQTVQRLGCLPLALHQVSGLILRKNLSFHEFLTLYQKPTFQQDVHKFRERGFRNNYERMLFDVWTYDNLKPEGICLLECCALLDPDRIPESIFLADTMVLVDNFPHGLEAYETARTDLFKSSLVKRLQGNEALSIHRVLQDAVRGRMTDSHFCKVFLSVMNMLIAVWPIQELGFMFKPELWSTYAMLLPHIDHLLKMLGQANPFTDNVEASRNFTAILVKAGWYLCERGDFQESLSLIEKAQEIAEPFRELLAREIADIDYTISLIASYLKDWERRIFHVNRNMVYRAAHPEEVFDLALAHNEMAYFHNEFGRYRQATEEGIKALEVYQGMQIYSSGEQVAMHPRLNTAIAYYFLGEAEQAESYAEFCLRRLESSEWEWNFSADRTANTLYVLGNIRILQGRFDESFLLQKRALNHYRDTMGKLHAHTLKAYVKVADHYVRLQEYELATTHLDTALSGWGDVSFFAPEKARALYKKSQILELQGQNVLANGTNLNAEKTWYDWYASTHESVESFPKKPDYDKYVPFWAR